jgi:LysR family transcriptional regulator for metE and metH
MIELRHLRTLFALRETGSLVDAAEKVFLTQSALSHQIKDLEYKLGLELFIRKTKPVEFTTAGQRLLLLADDLLPQIRNTERELTRLAVGSAGRLNIAIECHSCFQWLMPSLDRYRSDWPEIELDLASGFNFTPLPALRNGELDLVITANPKDLSGISYVPLFSYESVLAVSNRHPLAQKSFIEPEDIADQTLICYPVDRDMLDVFVQFLDPADVEPAGIRHAELTVMMMQLVASGRGVCALPNWALDEYTSRGYVTAVPMSEAGIWCTLYAAVRSDQTDSKYMMDFLVTARETSAATLVGVKQTNQLGEPLRAPEDCL